MCICAASLPNTQLIEKGDAYLDCVRLVKHRPIPIKSCQILLFNERAHDAFLLFVSGVFVAHYIYTKLKIYNVYT